MAVREINGGGGVLGRKLELNVVDDGCGDPMAYEAAKTFVAGTEVAGVIGGMCDAAAARAAPVIDSTGLPFLITSATANDIVNEDSTSSYMLNGTVYQQALSTGYWMNYSGAERLAVLQDETPASKELARQAIGLVDEVPKLVSLQTVEPGGQDMETIAKAAVASKPNFVLWTGGPAKGGELVKALREAGYEGTFTATAASEDPAFLAAAGEGGEGAFVTATSTPRNTPSAQPWRARFEQRYRREPGFDAQQGYDAVRVLAHAMNKARSTESAKVLASLELIDPNFSNSLGVVRFARDHTLLYDNRVILKVEKGAFTWERSLRTDSLG
jgi:branched-chain amino acid transport system substrate-binding protein